jgi:hypothetical protein
VQIRRWALLLAGIVLFSLVPSSGARSADKSSWKNPFCSADVAVAPWNRQRDEAAPLGRNDRYFLSLFADGKSKVSATVILISTQGAYTVTISSADLLREAGTDTFYAAPVLVGFDKPQNVEFAYVDTVGVDGAPAAACPTVVKEVRSLQGRSVTGNQAPSLAGAPVTPAIFKQDLPPLDCGAAYIPAELLDREGPDIGHFGDRPLTTVVHVFLDSEGHPMNATLERTSGVQGVDDIAVAGAERSHYKPAKFLCTPVVSQMSIDFVYGY